VVLVVCVVVDVVVGETLVDGVDSAAAFTVDDVTSSATSSV